MHKEYAEAKIPQFTMIFRTVELAVKLEGSVIHILVIRIPPHSSVPTKVSKLNSSSKIERFFLSMNVKILAEPK